jgi:hypothetical protein
MTAQSSPMPLITPPGLIEPRGAILSMNPNSPISLSFNGTCLKARIYPSRHNGGAWIHTVAADGPAGQMVGPIRSS